MTSDYRGVRAAVLGATGFIGRWVVRQLSAGGASVYPIYRSDLPDPDALDAILSQIRPAITFNLAGYGIDPSERDEAIAYRVNAELPAALCEAAARWRDPFWPGQHVIHVGSIAEDWDSLYGKSKREGSRLFAERTPALGLRGLTARLYAIYGPGEHPSRLLPSLIEASRAGQPIDLTAGGQSRDFTYVEDAAEGLLRLGLARTGAGAVHLATGRLTAVRTFVEIAAAVLGIPPRNLRFGAIPTRGHETEHGAVSLEDLHSLTGWAPSTSIAEGVRRSMEIDLHR